MANSSPRRYMQMNPEPSTPLVYRLQRCFFAGSMIVGTAAIVVAAATNPPYYGSEPGIASAIATNAVESDLMDQTHLVAQLIAAYLLPLGFLAMAWLANRRAPWLAGISACMTM